MDYSAERMRILEMIEVGRITAAEGVRLLESLGATEDDSPPGDENPDLLDETWVEDQLFPARGPFEGESALNELSDPADPIVEPLYADHPAGLAQEALDPAGVEAGVDLGRFRDWWIFPFWLGLGAAVTGAALAYAAARFAGTASIWFLCALSPTVLGILMLTLAWLYFRSAVWLHLRIQQAPGESPERIAISLPLPIGPAAWLLRVFVGLVPPTHRSSLGQLLLALQSGVGRDSPIYIQVDEGDGGEKVEIYIG